MWLERKEGKNKFLIFCALYTTCEPREWLQYVDTVPILSAYRSFGFVDVYKRERELIVHQLNSWRIIEDCQVIKYKQSRLHEGLLKFKNVL